MCLKFGFFPLSRTAALASSKIPLCQLYSSGLMRNLRNWNVLPLPPCRLLQSISGSPESISSSFPLCFSFAFTRHSQPKAKTDRSKSTKNQLRFSVNSPVDVYTWLFCTLGETRHARNWLSPPHNQPTNTTNIHWTPTDTVRSGQTGRTNSVHNCEFMWKDGFRFFVSLNVRSSFGFGGKCSTPITVNGVTTNTNSFAL